MATTLPQNELDRDLYVQLISHRETFTFASTLRTDLVFRHADRAALHSEIDRAIESLEIAL